MPGPGSAREGGHAFLNEDDRGIAEGTEGKLNLKVRLSQHWWADFYMHDRVPTRL